METLDCAAFIQYVKQKRQQQRRRDAADDSDTGVNLHSGDCTATSSRHGNRKLRSLPSANTRWIRVIVIC